MVATLRWMARALGILSSLFFLLSLIGSLGEARTAPLPAADWVKLAIHGTLPLGVVLAFRREGLGSAVILAGYLAQVALSPRFFGLPSLLLYALPGVLFGISWLGGRAERTTA